MRDFQLTVRIVYVCMYCLCVLCDSDWLCVSSSILCVSIAIAFLFFFLEMFLTKMEVHDWTDWLVNLWDLPVFTHSYPCPRWSLQMHTTILTFQVDAGDLNSSPHAHTTSTSSIEPSLQHLFNFYSYHQ